MAEKSSLSPHAGVIVAVHGDEATLRFSRGKMCAHCGACLSAGLEQMELTLPNTLGAVVGDTVTVEMRDGQVAGASLVAYAIPLAFLLMGVWIGSNFSELAALLAGLGGCAVSFAVLRVIDKRLKRQNRLRPSMRSILQNDLPEENEN